VVVEGDGAPMTTNISDGNPLGVHLQEGVVVEGAWLSDAGKDFLEKFDGKLVDRMDIVRN